MSYLSSTSLAKAAMLIICMSIVFAFQPLELKAAQKGKNYALLVGVNKYSSSSGLTNLHYPEGDIETLAKVLQTSGYEKEDVIVMTHARGTKDFRFFPLSGQIHEELGLLLKALEPEDTLLLAFAGHGVQFKADEDCYFCPSDTSLKRRSTLISFKKIYEDLEKCKAGFKLLLCDACRNDPLTPNTRATEVESKTRPQALKPPGGMAAFFSCSSGEVAYESNKVQHGVFFHFVIEALQGKADLNQDKAIMLPELELYVKEKVPPFVRTNHADRQSPHLVNNSTGLHPILKLPNLDKPKLLSAPFSAATAKSYQEQWAKYLYRNTSETNSLGMKFSLIPYGQFLMGRAEAKSDLLRGCNWQENPQKPDEFNDEQPQHWARVAKPYFIGVHEVTVGQFRKFVEDTNYVTDAETDDSGSGFYVNSEGDFKRQKGLSWKKPGILQNDSHPVVHVSWNDANSFCGWLSRKEGKTYRLPREAEWEFATRAGTKTRYWNSDDPANLAQVGNVRDATLKAQFPNWGNTIAAQDGYVYTSPVGQFQANPFGLYDVHGNVWELCADWYDANYFRNAPLTDPQGPTTGIYRVSRGGCFY